MADYLVDQGLMAHQGSLWTGYKKASDLIKARVYAMDYLKKYKDSRPCGVYNAQTKKLVGFATRPYMGDTEFIWKVKKGKEEVTYDLLPNGRLGGRWGRRPGY